MYQLHSGATRNEITGAYHKNPQKEMITIVDKHEYRKLMDFVKETDPKAFVTVYAVNEICYQPRKKACVFCRYIIKCQLTVHLYHPVVKQN